MLMNGNTINADNDKEDHDDNIMQTEDLFDVTTREKRKLQKGDKLRDKKAAHKYKEICDSISNALNQPIRELLSTQPTTTLYIVISGIGSTISKQQLQEVVQQYGTISNFQLFTNRPFAIVCFVTMESAKNARNELNSVFCQKLGRVLYLEYAIDSITQSLHIPLYSECEKEGYIQGMKDVSLSDKKVLGLQVVDNFVTQEEEEMLISWIYKQPWNILKSRRVQHYGYEFDYNTNNVDKSKYIGSLPSKFDVIIRKMVDSGIVSFTPDQLTINEYEPGAGIRPHVDTHSAFEDGIISLSLESSIVMEMRHPNGEHIGVLLPSRSLLILREESRYVWTHGITARKSDSVQSKLISRGRRVSLTFRKVKQTPCKCNHPAQCDSQLSAERKDGVTTVEAKFVHEVYDAIAPHFSATRYKPWPKVEKFLLDQPIGSIVADVGCGNGKYLGVNPSIFKIGSDRSGNLIKICNERGHEAMVCDILNIPYRSESFDISISIAVIHHLSTEEHRIHAIKELLRITKIKGRILLYVWAMEQEENTFQSQDLFVPWNMKDVYDNTGHKKSTITNNDVTESKATTKKNNNRIDSSKRVENEESKTIEHNSNTRALSQPNFIKFQRYYHVFKEGELNDLVKKINGVNIVDTYYDHANWCVILEKQSL